MTAGLPDDALVRIARAEAAGLCRMADVLRGLFPQIPMRIQRPEGACLMAMGPGHFVNRVSGLGLDGPVAASTLEGIEREFDAAGVRGEIEIWPGTASALQVMLEVRGYIVSPGRRILAAPVTLTPAESRPAGPVEIHRVTETDAEVYEHTVALGYMNVDQGEPGLAQRVFGRAAARSPHTVALLARIAGEPAGGGAMGTNRGVAGLFGASTLPRFRGQGVQRALLRRRLEIAAEAGCDLAVITTEPDTGSERNARRAGFRVMVDAVLWKRAERT
jgi:GNAT superfamily N-acetyltransferase